MVANPRHVGSACCLLCTFLLSTIRGGSAQIMSVDLGHEFFKVALMRQGVPLEIVLNKESKRKTTTAVSYKDSTRAFGDDALAHAGKAPTQVPMFFHNFMGQNFTSSEDVKPGGAWWKTFGLGDSFYSYSLGYNEKRGVPQFHFTQEEGTSSEAVLASVLQFARGMAEESADGKQVRDTVVTVSADANLRQRQAVMAAGEIAGLRVLTLVHEGSAFAVQRAVDYQPEKNTSEIILFYNMGSRHTEVTVTKFESKQAGMVAGKTAPVVTVLGSATDFSIGGHLMDLKIATVMLKKFQDENPKLADGIAKNPRALRKLVSTAQKTKAVLSANKKSPYIVESLYEDIDSPSFLSNITRKNFQSSITREEFEEMCADMLGKLTEPVEKAMEAAGVPMTEIAGVELIGGGWRVPKVQSVLSEYFEAKVGKKIQLGQHLNGEEGAATGAALMGANGSTSFRVKKIFFADITSHEYAVQVASLTGEWEKHVMTLYPVGSILGGKKKLSFSLAEDFAIRLFEDSVLVAEYAVTGLADQLKEKWAEKNLTGQPKMSVSVALENSGIIEIKTPFATVEEAYWVNEKFKRKKYEKKLSVKRTDFKPMPLSEEDIEEAKKLLNAAAAALKATKKPKDKKTDKKDDKKDDKKTDKKEKAEEKMPETIEETEKEIASVAVKKSAAVEKEDFDAAHLLKLREKALKEHLGRLQASKSEL